jgi:hypothetical protein
LWTSYVPILLAARNALRIDAAWPGMLSDAIVLFAPILLVAVGIRDFLSVVSVAGGVFLGLQYVLILLIARRALRARGVTFIFPALAFAGAALYELWSFGIH